MSFLSVYHIVKEIREITLQLTFLKIQLPRAILTWPCVCIHSVGSRMGNWGRSLIFSVLFCLVLCPSELYVLYNQCVTF